MTIVRAIFGVFGTYTGVWALVFSDELNKDVANGHTYFSNVVLAVTAAFFLFECLMVTLTDLYYGGFQILVNIHHWLGLLNFSSGLIAGKMHFFGCGGLVLEMTTPFSAICWTLLKCNMSNLRIWKANQFLLVHLFHVRSVIEVYFWYVTYKNFSSIYNSIPTHLFVLMYTGLTMVTFVMTPYWTYRKTQQLINPFDFNFRQPLANGYVKKE